MKNYINVVALVVCSFLNAQNHIEKINELTEKMWEHYYYERDSAYFYVDRINEIARKNNDIENQVEALINSNGIASYHFHLERSRKDLVLLENQLNSELYKTSSQFITNTNMLLYYKGAYFLKLYEYGATRKAFKKIIENVSTTPDTLMNSTLEELSSVSLSFIGKTYLEEGKFDLAKQFYNKDIRTIINKTPVNLEALYDNYNLLAEVFRQENKYTEAIKYLRKTFRYHKEKKNRNSTITSAFNISQNYAQLGQTDSAFFYLEQAKIHFNNTPLFSSKYHLVKSKILSKNKKTELALNELNMAIEKLEKNFGNSKNLNIAIARNEIGNLLASKGEFETALKNYNLGLKEISQIKTSSAFALKILKNKSTCLNYLANKNAYIKSIEVVDTGILKLDSLKPSFKNHSDKLVLIEDAFPLFESGLEAVFELYTREKDINYIDKAFLYAEKSKSILLMEALLAAKATEFTNIPDNILEREQQLKSEITYIEKQLNRAKETDNEKEDLLFDLQEEHRQLMKRIETNYKTYFDLKYNTKTLSLSDTQKLLKPDEKLVSYFYGNSAIYAIGVDKISKQIERIPIDVSFENNVENVHQMLSDSKSDITNLSKASFKLYSSLVAPFVTSEEKKKLIIITDGLLNYIPFGALNTSSEKLSYLAEHHAISYANSATLLAQLQEKEQNQSATLLAFAPSFKGEQVVHDPNRGNLLPLPHNKKEVEQILTSFEGLSFVGKNASLQNFSSEIKNYKILHLATHAIFDDAAPEYSYLAFTQENSEENLLYVSDLYNLQIDADLVTLSACESGIGELKRGEGFLSLARGFFYSGAASIASTLWKVNDASSTTLMGSFYKNLANGDTKDLALQRAKKSFLKTNRQNGLSHPYYWSGFIISGNTSALTTPTNWLLIVMALIAIIAILGFVLVKKLTKN